MPALAGDMECVERVLFDEATIAARIAEMGSQLAHEYADKEPVIICVSAWWGAIRTCSSNRGNKYGGPVIQNKC